MPVIRKDKLRESLKRREIGPVYLLHGAERFLRDLAVKTIADLTFSKDELRDFNENEFCLNQVDSLQTALAAAEQLPMMSARRLIRIRDVRISLSGRSDTVKDEHENLLSRFLDRPPAHSVIVFIADELNGTRRISKLLKEKCITVEFEQLDVNERLKWARDRISEFGFEIDDPVLRHFVALAGSDLNRLANEINKVTAAALPEKRITGDLVDSLVADRGEIGQWDFMNNLNAGRPHEALALLRKMLDDGQEPLMILGQISGSFRRSMIEGRVDVTKAAKRMQRLAETDLAIKTSVGTSGPAVVRMQLEKLVCELTLI
jgi:DNA polymerase III subunit delta